MSGGNKRNFGIDAVESHCDAVTYQYVTVMVFFMHGKA